MKQLRLIMNETLFQYRYGFYLLYGFFTLFYIVILNMLPDHWHQKASTVIIVSDPILIGLMFMGAWVLFEKSERVLHSLAVSPITALQYVMSKSISMGLIALLSATLIVWGGSQVKSIPMFILAVGIGSQLFCFIGLIISAGVGSLNGFLIRVMPLITLVTFPAVLHVADIDHWSLQLHPTTAIINMIAYTEGTLWHSMVVLCIWACSMLFVAQRRIQKMMMTL